MKKNVMMFLSFLIGLVIGKEIVQKWDDKIINNIKEMSDKHLSLFLMMNEWVRIKQEGQNLRKYMEEKNFKIIAIYGMSYVGERLLEEFENSDITVKYAIDKNANEIYSNINIVSPYDELESVDAVIVTAISFMNEIENILCDKLSCPIISLEDILYEL